jgi:kynureninase
VSFDSFQRGERFATAMDARDPLARFRQCFFIPKTNRGEECIYFCGHSLGLQPKAAASYIDQELQDWAKLGVEGHFRAKHPWVPYHRLLTAQTAELAGAEPQEIVLMNSLTVNLHLMMASFYRPTAERNKILIESGAFPSDQYAVKSQIRFHAFDPASSVLEISPRQGESCLREEDIESVIEREGRSIGLILFAGVNYATGQVFDMEAITRAGHRRGCIVGFDLAHAIGNIPLRMHDWGADFAVWCSYKYLNGGPGCVAGCFVHDRYSKSWDLPRLAGWWGHDEKIRFLMGPEFHPMPGAEGWQLSNPPILALAPLRASMELFSEAGMARLRAKSISVTGYLDFLLRQEAPGFSIITPTEEQQRGAQVSIRLGPQGHDLADQLAHHGVIGDWREPDIFRVAPVPLYNSYQDVYRFVKRLSEALV